MKWLQSGLKSKHTTAAAVLAAAAAVLSCLAAVLDGNAETTPNWVETGALISVAYGLLAARDSNKSSEEVEAK